jgi:hypothetical protein
MRQLPSLEPTDSTQSSPNSKYTKKESPEELKKRVEIIKRTAKATGKNTLDANMINVLMGRK